MAPPSADIDTSSTDATAVQDPTINLKSKLAATSDPVATIKPQHVIHEARKGPNGLTQSSAYPKPLTYSGSLDAYESFDVTNVIGREYPKLQLSEILADDSKIRDLAIQGKLF